MDTQFDDEDIFAPVDPEKEYYCNQSEKCKGFTRLMKLVLLSEKNPELVDEITEYLKFCPEELNKQNKKGYTALMYASKYSLDKTVKVLLDAGADPNIRSLYWWTALMFASRCGSSAETINTLLEAGADPNVRDFDGRTALGVKFPLSLPELDRFLDEAPPADNAVKEVIIRLRGLIAVTSES